MIAESAARVVFASCTSRPREDGSAPSGVAALRRGVWSWSSGGIHDPPPPALRRPSHGGDRRNRPPDDTTSRRLRQSAAPRPSAHGSRFTFPAPHRNFPPAPTPPHRSHPHDRGNLLPHLGLRRRLDAAAAPGLDPDSLVFHELCPAADLEEGAGRPFTVDGTHLAVFRYEDGYYACDNPLPPHGLPPLGGQRPRRGADLPLAPLGVRSEVGGLLPDLRRRRGQLPGGGARRPALRGHPEGGPRGGPPAPGGPRQAGPGAGAEGPLQLPHRQGRHRPARGRRHAPGDHPARPVLRRPQDQRGLVLGRGRPHPVRQPLGRRGPEGPQPVPRPRAVPDRQPHGGQLPAPALPLPALRRRSRPDDVEALVPALRRPARPRRGRAHPAHPARPRPAAAGAGRLHLHRGHRLLLHRRRPRPRLRQQDVRGPRLRGLAGRPRDSAAHRRRSGEPHPPRGDFALAGRRAPAGGGLRAASTRSGRPTRPPGPGPST